MQKKVFFVLIVENSIQIKHGNKNKSTNNLQLFLRTRI